MLAPRQRLRGATVVEVGSGVRALLLVFAALVAAIPLHAEEDEMRPFLEPTEWVDSDHPQVIDAARRAMRGAASEREIAVRLHDFVRDEIRFGWTHSFYRMKASDVLRTRIGYCNTKATLFVALLRASGIPARQRFVDLDARVLSGLLTTGRAYVDHSFTEVKLDGVWRRTDSYVVDAALFRAARERLARDGGDLGWGVHRNGAPHWDGAGDAFVQWVNDGSVEWLTTVDHGVFEDAPTFYATGRGNDRLAGMRGFLIRVFVEGGTARAERLRAGAARQPLAPTAAASGSAS